MMSYKGVDVARHLNELGIDAFVLKYRLTYTDPNAQPAAARPAASSSGGPQAGQNVGKLRAPTASRRCVSCGSTRWSSTCVPIHRDHRVFRGRRRRAGHGDGSCGGPVVKKGGGVDHYLERLDEWLKLNGWLSKPGA